MIKTFKVQLLPNNKQRTKLFQNAGTARFVYNWAIAYQRKNHESGGKFQSDYDLRKILTQLKQTDEFRWLNDYSNNTAKQAVKDACDAYKRFFKGLSTFPKFKSKKKSKPSFYVDTAKIKITETHVKLEKLSDSRKANRQKLNWVRLAEHGRIPISAIYSNPRVTFDGLHWWLSVGVECPESVESPKGEGVGIDIGVKELAVCSDGNTYANINKTRTIKKLQKRRRRQQRKVSRKYMKNKKGGSYWKTHNIKKAEHQLLKLNRRLTNIRRDWLHRVTGEITDRKPMFVVLEDLNVSGMMKNHHLAKAVQEQGFHEFYRQMEYKCRWKNIEFITADRYYPSSKMCCMCGHIKKDLKLSERIYVCPICGNTIDRDFQASVNLKRYRESIA